MAGQGSQLSYRRAFWGAVIVTVVLWVIPFGGLLIYPFSLLATWAHELGHGLAALLAGGQFERLELYASLGGVALTRTGQPAAQAIVAAGGLIGAPLLGAAIIALGPRPRLARAILAVVAAALAGSVALWIANPFGIIACIALAVGLGLAAWRLSARRRFLLVQLVGIQLGLSALRGWDYLFAAEASVGGRIMPSDVAAIARAVGGHHLLWGLLLTLFNLGLLYGAYRLARRRLRRDAAMRTGIKAPTAPAAR